MMRRGPKPIFFFPPAAFLLTILSFTSIKPASVFALYVATVSRALPWAVHRDVYPCWWCKRRGCGGPNGAAQPGAGRGNWERGRSDAPPGQGELHGCCHPPGATRTDSRQKPQPCVLLSPVPPILSSLAGPEHVPAGLPAQPGLRLAETKFPPGGSGPAALPAAPPGPPGLLRRVPGGPPLGCHPGVPLCRSLRTICTSPAAPRGGGRTSWTPPCLEMFVQRASGTGQGPRVGFQPRWWQ